jgi:transposase-like protein
MLVPGETMYAVAQRHDQHTIQLFTWRKRFRTKPAFAVATSRQRACCRWRATRTRALWRPTVVIENEFPQAGAPVKARAGRRRGRMRRPA